MPMFNIPDGNIQNQGRNYGKDNPFAGTSYEDMWMKNPYRNLYYEPTFWDNIGLSNKAKDANSEYERLYNEYIAGIYDQQRQDIYNSPTAESERMKAAGLNPDLLGLSGNGTNEMAPPNAGMNPALTGQSPAVNGINTITSVLGFATSALSQIKNIQALTDMNELSAYQILQGPARDIVEKEFGARIHPDYEPLSADDIYKERSYKFSSSRNNRRMKDAVRFAFYNANEDAAKYDWNSTTEESRFRYGRNVGHPDWSPDDKAMFSFIRAQMNFERQIQKIDLSSGAIKKRNEALLSNMRQKYYNYMYDLFENTGSLLAGLLLLGQQPTVASYFGAAGKGVETDINKGINRIRNFFNEFKF